MNEQEHMETLGEQKRRLQCKRAGHPGEGFAEIITHDTDEEQNLCAVIREIIERLTNAQRQKKPK